MFTEQESASNEVGASTDPFRGIWSIFRVDFGPRYWGLREFLPFSFESFAPNCPYRSAFDLAFDNIWVPASPPESIRADLAAAYGSGGGSLS